MSRNDSLHDFLSSARDWRARLARVEPPPGLSGKVDREAVLGPLLNLERRAREGPRAPVRVALFGPTGAGKSKLFNSLVGEVLSPASYRRPCTRRPLYLLHRSRQTLAAGLAGEVRLHDRQGWEDLLLIDAPDFDSVEAENRAAAVQVYLEADAFVFVADVHKYADASVWTYLERIRGEGKRCAFVLNKTRAAGAAGPAPGAGPAAGGPWEDFRRRLEELYHPELPPGPLIAVGDFPQGDDELLPAGEPGVLALRVALQRFLASGKDGRPAILGESLRLDLERFLAAWDRFAGPIREYRAGLARLAAELDLRFEREAEALARDLEAELDPGLKGELYRQVLRRIERLDVLRFPRQLLALPATGLKLALGRLWPGRGRAAAGEAGGEDAAAAVNLAALQGRIQELAEDMRRAARAEPACPELLPEDEYRSLLPDRVQVEELYRASIAGFKDWVQRQAGSAADTLTAEHKAKFILSQVIYNTVVIGIQVKTAGTLTLGEMLTDGVLSPLVAKAVGMAVSSDRVREFEEEARREHARRLQAILQEVRDRFAAYLTARGKGLEEIEAMGPGVETLRASRERLLDDFAGGAD